jgi:hypothetical protein
MAIDKNKYPRKTVGIRPTKLYLWSPETDLSVVKGSGIGKGGAPKANCNATKGSQGYDNITKYVYELIVVDGIQQKLAYVECDYVQ